ncbi:MAG: protoheme IX farnesyltransferase [Candidatus Omnitrophica bacterium]|nr:protoheme IX farnesyltransferase [Candidatus Omnitrophota bacterium]
MRSQRLLHRYAIVTAIATFLLLIAGSLVTSTDSGLAVPDWPFSYGMLFPPMVGGIFYEHGHRMIAGVVALLILGLAIWTGRTESRGWVRRLSYAALGGVLLQALLGGLTVLLLLPPQMSIAHACVGPTVFCLVVCLAHATAPTWIETPAPLEPRGMPFVRIIGLLTIVAVAVQFLLGAVIRHTGYGVSAHFAGAVTVCLIAGWLAARVAPLRASAPLIWRQMLRLLALLAVQVFLGVSVWMHRGAVPLRTGHVAVGALVLAQSVILAWEMAQRSRVARADATSPASPASGAAPSAHGSLRAVIVDYLELTKPRLSGLVLMTTAVGFWLGVPASSRVTAFAPLLIGTWMVVAGANAFNQWMERSYDALMRRTQDRPLPAGRLTPEAAFRFALILSVAGLACLMWAVNALAAILAAIGWASYVLLYTPLKRRSPLCTLVGAVPGALPPMIGWAGARGTLNADAWLLFAILFIWQLPHFLALVILYQEDYARAGFRMLPLVDSGEMATARQTALYGLALLPISLFPTLMGVAGRAYFVGATILGCGFLLVALRAAWLRSLPTCRRLFRASVVYLPALLVLLAIDRVPR